MKLAWHLVGVTMIGATAGALSWMEPKGLRTLLTLHEEASKLQLEIGHLSSELEKFKREWELLQKDRVYLERVVRTESGYLAPNEILIEWLDKSK